MESFEARLSRFLDNPPHESVNTFAVSIQRNLMPEIRGAAKARLGVLVLLGTHAVIQVVAGKLFRKPGQSATHFFLEHFVDTADSAFSTISKRLHELRNIAAHQWLSATQERIVLDWEMAKGFEIVGGDLHINFGRYAEQFESQFNERFSYYLATTSEAELLILNARAIATFLDLSNKDPLKLTIDSLYSTMPLALLRTTSALIAADVRKRYLNS